MLTLKIPGDAVTAVIIGVLFIHGLKPGPLLLVETPHLFWFIVGSLTLANIFLLLFGLVGYFMKIYGFQVGPVILGVILGPMMDSNYRRAMLGARGDISTFLWNFVSHPITFVLKVALIAILASQLPWVQSWRRRRAGQHHDRR